NTTGGHAANIPGQDAVLKAFQSRLAFCHQVWFKRALPTTRPLDLDPPLLPPFGVFWLCPWRQWLVSLPLRAGLGTRCVSRSVSRHRSITAVVRCLSKLLQLEGPVDGESL